MKYTINGFDQKLFHEYGLNLTDSFLLRWFIDFRDTDKMACHIIDNLPYYWVKYQAVINDFPCLEIRNTASIARRFDKFVKAGILKKHIKKNSNGTFSLFAIGENYSNLLTHPMQTSNPPDAKVEPPPDAKVEPKDSSTNINPSTNNQNTQAEPETVSRETNLTTELKQLFDKANVNLTGKKLSWIGKEKEYARNLQLIIKASENDFAEIRKRAAKLYELVKTDDWHKKQGFTPSSLLSNWNKLAEINRSAKSMDLKEKKFPDWQNMSDAEIEKTFRENIKDLPFQTDEILKYLTPEAGRYWKEKYNHWRYRLADVLLLFKNGDVNVQSNK